NLVARGAVDLHPIEDAIGFDGDRHHEAAVHFLVARSLWVVHLADTLDLDAPILDIARESEFLCARPDESPAWPLLVSIPVLVHLGLQASDFEAAAHEVD